MLPFLRPVCLSTALVLLASAVAWAQESGANDPRRDDGFVVNAVTASGTYFAQSVPQDASVFEDVFLGSGESVSGAVDLQWRRTRRKSLFSLGSTSIYGNRFQQIKRSNWSSEASNSWNEIASVLATRAFGHWRITGAADGAVMNFDEAMFATTASSRVVGVSSDFHTAAGALLNPATAAADGFQTDPTTVRFLFGRRVASAGGSGDLVYAPSQRLQIGFNAGVAQIRHLNDGTDVIGFDYLQANSAASGGYVTYAPSRWTQMGFEAKGAYSDSTFGKTTGASGSFSFQKMARKYWFASGSIGGGWTDGTSRFRTIVYSGGAGFSSRAHTFFGYYNRDISELYVPALGPDSAFFSTLNFSWFWTPRRSLWYSKATYSHYRDQPPAGIPAPTSWRMLETFGRQIGRHSLINAEYSIGKTGARRYIHEGKHFQLEENAARVSFSWSPRPFDRPR